MMRKQAGLSLIELMISLLLASLVLLGVAVLFQQSRQSSLQDDQIARMQENGRYALRVVGRELSMMNYFGGMLDVGADAATLDTSVFEAGLGNDCNTDWAKDLEPALEFENDATASPYDCIDDDDVLDGTDVVAIKRVGDQPDREYDETLNHVAAWTAPNTLTAGNAYFYTNAATAVLYYATSTTDTCSTCTLNIPEQSSNIRQYLPQVFYVRPYASDNDDGIPTLMRETLVADDMTAEVLVEGIEDMQIEWGVDGTDADLAPDYYTADPDNAELLDAVTARVYLLVRSIGTVTGYLNDKTYNLGTKAVGPMNDAYYRRVYSTTVSLRNSETMQMSSSD